MNSVVIDGVERFLGNHVPAKAASGENWTVYGDTPQTPLVSRSQWEKLTLKFDHTKYEHQHLPYVHDQDGIGQCNADATTGAVEFTRSAMGLEFVALASGDLYNRINGGSDNGSLLEDATREMSARGVGSMASYGGPLWQRGRSCTTEERALYKVPELYLCPTFDHCYSAVLSGFAIISGVLWYDNFKTDGNGWLPLMGSGRFGGHAIFGYKPTMRMFGARTVFAIWHQNSWTESFGVKGRMAMAESLYNGPVGGWWAVRQATDEGGTLPVPKF